MNKRDAQYYKDFYHLYRETSLRAANKYYENNKQKILQQRKNYYQKNKESIKNRLKNKRLSILADEETKIIKYLFGLFNPENVEILREIINKKYLTKFGKPKKLHVIIDDMFFETIKNN